MFEISVEERPQEGRCDMFDFNVILKLANSVEKTYVLIYCANSLFSFVVLEMFFTPTSASLELSTQPVNMTMREPSMFL